VRIWRQVRRSDVLFLKELIPTGDGGIEFQTAEDGRFQSGGPVPPDDEYVIEASAPTKLSARTAPQRLIGADQVVPDLVLPGLRLVTGRVADRQGQPVAGVRVFQSGDGPLRTETTTDRGGRFRLPGVMDEPAFEFATKAGYRLTFHTVGTESAPLELVISRQEDSPGRAYSTLTSALPLEQEKALARQLYLPYQERVLARGSDIHKFRLVMAVAQIDPMALAEKFETVKVSAPDRRDLARPHLVEGLAEDNLEDALAQAELCAGAEARALCYLGICDVRPDLGRTRAHELVDQALLSARAVKSPEMRLVLLGQVAEKLIDLQEKERARELLREAEELAGPTSKASGAALNSGFLFEAVARINLPAALAKLDELVLEAKKKDKRDRTHVFNRFYGDIASKIAAEAPADAERVLEHLRGADTAEARRSTLAVCSRMARTEPARARRIAETTFAGTSSALKAYALGLVAKTVATTDKARAAELLEAAFRELERLAKGGWTSDVYGTAQVAAGLLPIVEQVVPDLLAEFLARTLALREPLRDRGTGFFEADETVALAMMVGRYDRDVATALLRPLVKRLEALRGQASTDYVSWRVLAALALIDPHQAVEKIEKLPDDPPPGLDDSTPKNLARLQVARLLASHGEKRWRFIYEHFLNLWTPGQRYL
jgi:hypothetical protein